MTSTEIIKDMLERQKAYDAEVFKKHHITSISREQLESALFDELGELMHAQKADGVGGSSHKNLRMKLRYLKNMQMSFILP